MEKEKNINMTNVEQLKLLKEAFSSFNSATEELQQSYDKLKLQVKKLNIELEETNKKLKNNLKEKEELQEYLQNILENAPNGVVVIDNSGRIKKFNKAAEDITGYNFDDIWNQNIDEIIPGIKKNIGSKGKRFLSRNEIKFKDNIEKTINIYVSTLKDRKKRRIGDVIAFEDVSKTKRLEEQLERKNRLEAMGEMAAGISHEIRNPLGAIELFASLLKRDLKKDPEKEELAENIIAGVKSLTNITSNLLLFTKNFKPKRESIDIKKVMNDALLFTKYATVNKKVSVTKKYDKKIRYIHADGELLKQAFLNLALNAVQAIKKEGEIKVTVQKGGKDDITNTYEKGDYVKITIEDTGPGILRENIEKIFNPFFTTKRAGLGLGLAIVHKIITSHDGMIEVTSKKDIGTIFTIFLAI